MFDVRAIMLPIDGSLCIATREDLGTLFYGSKYFRGISATSTTNGEMEERRGFAPGPWCLRKTKEVAPTMLWCVVCLCGRPGSESVVSSPFIAFKLHSRALHIISPARLTTPHRFRTVLASQINYNEEPDRGESFVVQPGGGDPARACTR
jgi:hypothetical protein